MLVCSSVVSLRPPPRSSSLATCTSTVPAARRQHCCSCSLHSLSTDTCVLHNHNCPFSDWSFECLSTLMSVCSPLVECEASKLWTQHRSPAVPSIKVTESKSANNKRLAIGNKARRRRRRLQSRSKSSKVQSKVIERVIERRRIRTTTTTTTTTTNATTNQQTKLQLALDCGQVGG